MISVLAILLPAITLWLTSYILRGSLRKATLTPHRFGTIFSMGWSIAVMLFFFLGLSSALERFPDLQLSGLGILLTLLNLVISYPIARFIYQRVSQRAKPPHNP